MNILFIYNIKKEERMDIYSIFTLIGGLAFFLYGMTIMPQGLEKICILTKLYA